MSDPDDDESRILQRSQRGDQDAFAALVRAYQPMIHSLTFRMTGSLVESRDLAQEIFVRAYERLDGYRATARFSSWLYRIAVNACLDWRRSEQRRQRLHTAWSEASHDGQRDAHDGARLDELSGQVQAALMKLPEAQRAAIVLTVLPRVQPCGGGGDSRLFGGDGFVAHFSARRKLRKLLAHWEGRA